MKDDLQKLEKLLERRKNKKRHLKYPPKNEKRPFRIKDYVYLQQSTYKDKCFVLDLIEIEEGNKKYEEIRIGYYIKGKMPSVKGKWVWGQYCPFFPKEDLKALMKEAKKRGIIR